mmetsp:Transcript_32258/g.102857  ORF Transcript_32258/g.102857 Transcript_32258/m.102857 type:complete len:202 (+) Transcript_32258:535-1140(+)
MSASLPPLIPPTPARARPALTATRSQLALLVALVAAVPLPLAPVESAHRHLAHHDGDHRVVVARAHARDGEDDLPARSHLPKDRVPGGAAGEPVEVRVVGHIDEELRAAGVWRARVCHRQAVRHVGVARDVLVLDVAAVRARLRRAGREVDKGPVGRPARPRARRARVLAVRAAKLVHEAVYHAVEVEAVVEARLCEVHKV